MKFLIVGLGNIGDEYENTRHNIGFQILDVLAKGSNIFFDANRYAFSAEYKFKGRAFILIKPTTFMNLSGKAVNYWLQKEKIPKENLMVITDDIALPFGTLRMKPQGNDGGHNGLKNIREILGTSDYPRLRFGIGSNFPKGKQVEYVLSEWNEEEKKILPERITLAAEAIKSFGIVGIQKTMSEYNNK